MKKIKTITSLFTILAGLIAVIFSGCGEKGVENTKVEFKYEMLYGAWGATLIEGALDPNGNPLDVDSTVSSILFDEGNTYYVFLEAPPWYSVYGDGSYSYSDGKIHLTGIIPDMLGVTSISYRPGSNTINFRDNDGDRWAYKKFMELEEVY